MAARRFSSPSSSGERWRASPRPSASRGSRRSSRGRPETNARRPGGCYAPELAEVARGCRLALVDDHPAAARALRPPLPRRRARGPARALRAPRGRGAERRGHPPAPRRRGARHHQRAARVRALVPPPRPARGRRARRARERVRATAPRSRRSSSGPTGRVATFEIDPDARRPRAAQPRATCANVEVVEGDAAPQRLALEGRARRWSSRSRSRRSPAWLERPARGRHARRARRAARRGPAPRPGRQARRAPSCRPSTAPFAT